MPTASTINIPAHCAAATKHPRASTPFVEISADTRVHDVDVDTSGYQRDSNGLTGKIGSTFKLTHDLTGEPASAIRGGNYADPRFDTSYALVGDASLIWTANALTTVKLTVASTVGESTIPGVSGDRLARRRPAGRSGVAALADRDA